jgi:hypothetical protein
MRAWLRSSLSKRSSLDLRWPYKEKVNTLRTAKEEGQKLLVRQGVVGSIQSMLYLCTYGFASNPMSTSSPA